MYPSYLLPLFLTADAITAAPLPNLSPPGSLPSNQGTNLALVDPSRPADISSSQDVVQALDQASRTSTSADIESDYRIFDDPKLDFKKDLVRVVNDNMNLATAERDNQCSKTPTSSWDMIGRIQQFPPLREVGNAMSQGFGQWTAQDMCVCETEWLADTKEINKYTTPDSSDSNFKAYMTSACASRQAADKALPQNRHMLYQLRKLQANNGNHINQPAVGGGSGGGGDADPKSGHEIDLMD